MDAGVQHRRRREPRRHLRRGAHGRRRGARRRRAAARAQVLGDGLEILVQDSPARDLEPGAVHAARSTWSRSRTTRTSSSLADYVTTEDGTGPGAPVARVRRRRPRGLPRATACRWSTRSRPTGTSRRTCRWSAGCSSRRPTRRSSTTSSARGLLFRHVPVRAQLPALLALPHAVDVLRAAVLVHPHHGSQGRACCAENERTNWFPRHDQARPLRRLARATTSTGRCRATATGARRCRSGAAPTTT